MRCSRIVGLLVVVGLIGVAPSSLATSSDGSASQLSDLPAFTGSCSSLLYPPYNSAVNYCGPEWLQEAGFGFVVPRVPVPGVDFNFSCYRHDACYSECCQNGMSQAACDDRFEGHMESACADARDLLMDTCPWYAIVGCALAAAIQYADCYLMSGVYAEAVSYLGDGVIETAPLAAVLTPILVPLLGPSAPLAIAVAIVAVLLVPGIETDAAYPCPCACVDCPADEPLGAPSCAVTASGAVITQNVIHYHKTEPENVSGGGPECECVSGEEVVTTPCPSGTTCARNGRECAFPTCDQAACHAVIGPMGTEPYCVQADTGGYVLMRDYEERNCLPLSGGGESCQGEIVPHVEEECDSVCSPDGHACAAYSSVTLNVSVLTSEFDVTPCSTCWVRLRGAAGAYGRTTMNDGTATIGAVPEGQYVVEYGCGAASLGPHWPYDVYPGQPARWLPARGAWPFNTNATVTVPMTAAVDVTLAGCGVSTCSASGLSPVPVAQDLPAAVAGTRRRIIEAAVACDYYALTALASSGPYFAYSLDESGNPAGYWHSLEQSGTGQPLRDMVIALNLPEEAAEVGGEEGAYYLWSDGAGGATNYRAGISGSGQWLGKWLFFLPDD